MFPKVSIIILNWNGKDDTIECLESLKNITYPNYEILLVDNGSTDGSVKCFRKKYPEIEIIENRENKGFAEGNNIGIKRAMKKGVEYILLLNNDTVVDKNFLGELVSRAETNKRIGIVGPKVYYYDYNGEKNRINFAGGRIDMYKGKTYHIGLNQIDNGQYDTVQYVDYIEGSCILIKRQVISDVGMLDPDYFVYWEEIDLCNRITKEGYQLVYTPTAKIWHKIAASSNKKYSNMYVYFMTRNRLLFMKKNASIIHKITFIPCFVTDILILLLGPLIIKKDIKKTFDILSVVLKAVRNTNRSIILDQLK